MNQLRIADIVRVVGGGTPRRSETSYYGGEIPWVTPKDMKQRVIGSSSVKITQAGVANSPAKPIPPGSTLVVVRSGVLKHTLPVAITSSEVTVNQDMKALIPRLELVDSSYLSRLVKAQERRLLRSVRATTADNFPIESLLAVEIPLPPLPEQRRIAAILDEADALRTAQAGRIRLLDDFDEAAFTEVFGADGGRGSAKLGDLVKSAQLGIVRGAKDLGGDRKTPYLRMDSIEPSGRVRLTGLSRADVSPGDLEKYSLRRGDFLFNTRNSREWVGKAAPLLEDFNGVFNNNILRLRFNDPRFSLFLSYAWRRFPIRRQLDQIKSGTTSVFAIYARDLMRVRVPVPPDDALHHFVQVHAASTTLRRAAHAVPFDALFTSLQHRAFRGEL